MAGSHQDNSPNGKGTHEFQPLGPFMFQTPLAKVMAHCSFLGSSWLEVTVAKVAQPKRAKDSESPRVWGPTYGFGSKLNRSGYAGVGPCFHLPGQAISVPVF